jgi:hypothetical protein
MSRGALNTAALSSTGSAEIYIDGHSMSSVDLIITGVATASVETSNSNGALWTAYGSGNVTGATSSASDASFYSYEKIRVRVTSYTSGTIQLFFTGYSNGG